MIPDSVQQAAEEARVAVSAEPRDDLVVGPGVLAVAVAPGQAATTSRVVLVTGVNDATRTATIHLTTNVEEAATDLDLVVLPDETSAPVRLVLEAELYGPVFLEQLARRFGLLKEQSLTAFANSLVTDGESVEGLHVGLPLLAGEDPRRAFKVLELEDLDALVSECRTWLAGSPASTSLLDPAVLLPPPAGSALEDAEDKYLEALDALDALVTSGEPIPSELFTLLEDSSLLDEISRWRTEFGLNLARHIDRLLSGGVLPGDVPSVHVRDAPDHGVAIERVTEALVEMQAEAGRLTIDLVTTRRCWSARQLVVRQGPSGGYCRARSRVLGAA